MKDGDFDYLSSMSKDAEEDEEKVNWIGFKKQFFSAILASKTPFNKAKISSKNLVEDHKIDTVFTKQFSSVIELPVQNNEISANMQMYYGPTDYEILNSYEDYNFERLTIQGWAIVRVINKYFIMPMFNLLSSFIGSLGWVIIFLTIVVKLLMSPLLYKSFYEKQELILWLVVFLHYCRCQYSLLYFDFSLQI